MPLDNDIPRSRLTSLIERESRSSKQFPETDSPSFCRAILDGAFERVDLDNGDWIYRTMDGRLVDPKTWKEIKIGEVA